MKKLIIIRHGDYDDKTGLLNNNGARKIRTVAEVLGMYLEGNTRVLSSTAPRAVQSAGIICDELDLTYEQHDVLWVDHAHPENFQGVFDLVQAASPHVDTIILVTHYDYGQYFPTYYGKRVWSKKLPVESLNTGGMRILDTARQEVMTIQ